jgi:hypothetical protein
LGAIRFPLRATKLLAPSPSPVSLHSHHPHLTSSVASHVGQAYVHSLPRRTCSTERPLTTTCLSPIPLLPPPTTLQSIHSRISSHPRVRCQASPCASLGPRASVRHRLHREARLDCPRDSRRPGELFPSYLSCWARLQVGIRRRSIVWVLGPSYRS